MSSKTRSESNEMFLQTSLTLSLWVDHKVSIESRRDVRYGATSLLAAKSLKYHKLLTGNIEFGHKLHRL